MASYPRSGNTFLRIILNKVFDIKTYSVYNDKLDIQSCQKTREVVGHLLLPGKFNVDEYRGSEDEFFIKTHKYPDCSKDKVIYLVRDGRESITSYYHYRNTYNQAPPLNDFIIGNTKVGSWADHIDLWTTKHNSNGLLIIRFEDLIKNTKEFIDIIAQFIKRQPKTYDLPDFQELKSINPKFFRSGKNTSWKDLFTEKDHLKFWELSHEQMLKFGYTNDIPDRFTRLLDCK